MTASNHYALEGRIAVVTGAARGIGAAVAELLATNGARVVGLVRNEPQANSHQGAPTYMRCDITVEEQVRTAMERVREDFGEVDILVNNAGINAYFDAARMTEQEWDSVFAVDLKGAWLCTKHALPGMIAKGKGAIVNISSIHARMTLQGSFPYAAAKAGLEGLTRSLAQDLGPSGIRANAVAPGYTRTRLVEDWLAMQPDPDDTRRRTAEIHALGRMVEPSEVATAVCFLASDDAAAITGTTLAVDCGLSSRFAG